MSKEQQDAVGYRIADPLRDGWKMIVCESCAKRSPAGLSDPRRMMRTALCEMCHERIAATKDQEVGK